MQSILGQKLQEAIEAAEARKAMAEWNQSAVTSVTTTTTSTQPMTTKPTLTTSETVFNVARDAPGLTKMQIAEMVAQQGHRADSAAAMVSIMLRYGLLRMENGVVFAVGDKYKSKVEFNRGFSKKRKVTKKEKGKKVIMIRRPAPTEDSESSDPVNHPAHYKVGGIETIDFIKAKLTPEEFKGYLLGNVLKYASRAGHKDNATQDAGKMAWYATKLAELA